jgi:hypothetical protein
LAGALIGLAVQQPVLAVVLAFLSHFVMDALPHFGYAGQKGYEEALKHRLSYVMAIVTLVTTCVVLAVLAVYGAWFAIFTGLVAASPDAIGVYNWLAYEKHDRRATGVLKLFHVRFHRAIQWCERPWGVAVEVLAFVVLSGLLSQLL